MNARTGGMAVAAVLLLSAGIGESAERMAATADPMANNAAILKPAGDTASQVAFAYADRNEDALVSWEEYRNRAMRLFGRVDTNGDGILQIAELKALGGKGAPEPPFDVGLATFNAALRKHFDDADKNGDGVLSPAEWRNAVRPSKLF